MFNPDTQSITVHRTMTPDQIVYECVSCNGKRFDTRVSKASLGLDCPFEGGSDRGGVCGSSMVNVLERRKPGHP